MGVCFDALISQVYFVFVTNGCCVTAVAFFEVWVHRKSEPSQAVFRFAKNASLRTPKSFAQDKVAVATLHISN
jgi:hypothetical protein